jgi:hypothetical protein
LIFGALNITNNILHAGALSLLLIAVYAERRSASAAGEQAIPSVQKVFTPFYVISTAVGQFLGGPLFVAGVIFLVISSNSYSDNRPVVLFGMMTLVGFLLAFSREPLRRCVIMKPPHNLR